MLARDLAPDRITRAKMVFSDLVRELSGQRVGLIAFAGRAIWKCPLTTDLGAFSMFLNILDTDSVPFSGTNIASAINLASQSLQSAPKGSKALVLITDGENLDGNIDEAVKNAISSGIIIFTVGIGTTEGEPIPLYENGVFAGYALDAEGNTVISRLDEQTLMRIARQTGGEYFNLNNNPNAAKLLARRLNNLDKVEGQAFAFTNLKDRFYIPLAAAIIFLLLFFFTPDIKKFKFLAALAAIAVFSQSAYAASMFEGVRQYKEGNFPEAVEIFTAHHAQNPLDPRVNYNLASALYRNNDFENALRHFQTALNNTDDTDFKSVLLYNMGNASFRMGNREMAENFYKASLNLNPAGFGAKHNLEFLQQDNEQDQNQDDKNQNESESEPQEKPLDPRSQQLLDYFDEQDKYNQKSTQPPARRQQANFW